MVKKAFYTLILMIFLGSLLTNCSSDKAKVEDVVKKDKAKKEAIKDEAAKKATASEEAAEPKKELAKEPAKKTEEKPAVAAKKELAKEPAKKTEEKPPVATKKEVTKEPAKIEKSSVEKKSTELLKYVATYALNIRSGPGASHKVVGHVPFQTEVKVLKDGVWVQIGENQYVYGKYLSDTKLDKYMIVETKKPVIKAEEPKEVKPEVNTKPEAEVKKDKAPATEAPKATKEETKESNSNK